MAQRTPLQLLSGLVAKFTSSDTIDPVNLATGTPDGTKFLRDDGVWHPVMLYRVSYGVGTGVIEVPILEGETDGISNTKFTKLTLYAIAGGGGGGYRSVSTGNCSGGGGGAGIKLEIIIPTGTKAGADVFSYEVGVGGDGGGSISSGVSGAGSAGGNTTLSVSTGSGAMYRVGHGMIGFGQFEIVCEGGQPGSHVAASTAVNGGVGGNLQYKNAADAVVDNTNIEAATAVVQNSTGLQKHFAGGSGCGVSVSNAVSAAMPGASIYGGGGGGSCTSAGGGTWSAQVYGLSYTHGLRYGLGGAGRISTVVVPDRHDGADGIIICEWS
jgi:hypothetical protein